MPAASPEEIDLVIATAIAMAVEVNDPNSVVLIEGDVMAGKTVISGRFDLGSVAASVRAALAGMGLEIGCTRRE